MTKSTCFVTVLVLACLLSACNLNQPEPEVIFITATPDATATVTPPPSATPTATVPPTPTVEPGVVLEIADRYLVNGYFENAVLTYQTVLNQGAPQDINASAAFRLGQAALREGLFTDAVTSLTTFIDQYPQDERIAQAYFLRGDAYLGLSSWTEAIADFQQYLALRPGLIDSYAYERLGDAQLALNQLEPALASYNQSVNANRTLTPLLALREKLAQVLRNAARPDEAIIQYDAILAAAQNELYKANIDYAAAQTLIESDNL